MASGMLDEVTSRLERHAAHLTLVGQAALMSLHMNFFVFLTSERLVTDLTLEGLFSSMASIMCCQRVLFLKGHGALVALKGVLLEMAIDMVFQLHLVSKRLVAIRHCAGKRPFGIMNGLYVFVEASLFSELLVAIGTHLWHNIAMKS